MEGGVAAGGSKEDMGTAFLLFRVRCEGLGPGEDVYLVPQDNPSSIRVSMYLCFSPKYFLQDVIFFVLLSFYDVIVVKYSKPIQRSTYFLLRDLYVAF